MSKKEKADRLLVVGLWVAAPHEPVGSSLLDHRPRWPPLNKGESDDPREITRFVASVMTIRVSALKASK